MPQLGYVRVHERDCGFKFQLDWTWGAFVSYNPKVDTPLFAAAATVVSMCIRSWPLSQTWTFITTLHHHTKPKDYTSSILSCLNQQISGINSQDLHLGILPQMKLPNEYKPIS